LLNYFGFTKEQQAEYISISISITFTAKMLTRLLLTGEKHNSVFLDKNLNLLE